MTYSIRFTALITIILLLIVLLCKKRKNHVKTKLDKIGVCSNIILSVVYVAIPFLCKPFSFMNSIPELFPWLLFFIPSIIILSIFLSVVLRKRGKSIVSFCVQFIPLAIYAIIAMELVRINVI